MGSTTSWVPFFQGTESCEGLSRGRPYYTVSPEHSFPFYHEKRCFWLVYTSVEEIFLESHLIIFTTMSDSINPPLLVL